MLVSSDDEIVSMKDVELNADQEVDKRMLMLKLGGVSSSIGLDELEKFWEILVSLEVMLRDSEVLLTNVPLTVVV